MFLSPRTRACLGAALGRAPRACSPLPRRRARRPNRASTRGIPIRPSRRSVAAGLAALALVVALVPLAARAADGQPRVADAPAQPDSDTSADGADQADERAMTPEARALYERGLAFYGSKDYAGAIRAFEDGFARDPRREFLFANAQARRLAGDCRGAVPLYQRFLGMSPPPVQESATQIALGRCAQQMATTKIEPPAPAPPPVPPAPPPPWTHDRWGAALLATGVVGVGVGVGFLAGALAARPSSNEATYAAFDDARGRADTRLTISIVGFAAGGALVAAGVARYAWVRRARRLPATLTVVPGGLALGGSF